MTPSLLLYRTIQEVGIDFFVSVPCKLLAELIALLEKDQEIIYTPVTREEEGVGIMAGAFLAGKRPAIVMQNSGLGNCINAICSLVNYYRLSFVFIISHRGTEGETIDAQRPMGRATVDLLRAADIPFYEINSSKEISILNEATEEGFKNQRSVAFLFPFSFWQ